MAEHQFYVSGEVGISWFWDEISGQFQSEKSEVSPPNNHVADHTSDISPSPMAGK